jgi:hypothetical protein
MITLTLPHLQSIEKDGTPTPATRRRGSVVSGIKTPADFPLSVLAYQTCVGGIPLLQK